MTTGDIYTVAGNGEAKAAGEGATENEPVYQPFAVAFDSAGDLAISETGTPRVRLLSKTSTIHFGIAMSANHLYSVAGNGTFGFSGDGEPAVAAKISQAEGLSLDASGNLVIADTGNDRIRVEPVGKGSLFGVSMEEDNIYTVAGNGTTGFSGDGRPATESQLSAPGAIAFDPLGGFAIADFANNRIRFVSGGIGVFGQAMTAGDIYTIAGDGTGKFGGDGGPGTAAQLSEPEGVAFDGAGDLVIGTASTTACASCRRARARSSAKQ
jgi:hypothetical protein